MTQATQWVSASPQQYSPGDEIRIAFKWPANVESPVTTVYRNKTDISSTVLSGTDTASGNVSVTKKCTIQSTHGGSSYVIEHQATVGGIKNTALFMAIIRKAGEEQG